MGRYRPSFVDPARPDASRTVVRTPAGAALDVIDPALAAELGDGRPRHQAGPRRLRRDAALARLDPDARRARRAGRPRARRPALPPQPADRGGRRRAVPGGGVGRRGAADRRDADADRPARRALRDRQRRSRDDASATPRSSARSPASASRAPASTARRSSRAASRSATRCRSSPRGAGRWSAPAARSARAGAWRSASAWASASAARRARCPARRRLRRRHRVGAGHRRRLGRGHGRRAVARGGDDQRADRAVLAPRRAVVVARVATDRDDPAVAGAERVGLGELLRERHLARPPLAPGRAHDAAEAPAVAVVHHAQVEQVPELVQQHGSRLAHAGADVDRARAPAVDAAGGARQRGAALQPQDDATGHGRHQRGARPALPRAAERPAAGRAHAQLGRGARGRSGAGGRGDQRHGDRRSHHNSPSVLATRPHQGRYPNCRAVSPESGRARSSGRGPGRARRSRAA